MRITKRALTAAILLSCACLMAPYYAHAAHDEGEPVNHVTNPLDLHVNGTKFATFDLYTQSNDPQGYYTGKNDETADYRDLFDNEDKAITTSMKYLADMVGTPASTLNMNLMLYPEADADASAESETCIQVDENGKPITQISDSLLTATYLGKIPYVENEGVADITINQANKWYTAKFPVLPSNGTDSDYYGTITHEMFHAMGLGTYVRDVKTGSGDSIKTTYYFGTDPNEQDEDDNIVAMTNNNVAMTTSEQDTTIVFNKYEMGLRDAFGRVAYYEEQEGSDPVYYDGSKFEAKEPINPNSANPLAEVTGKLVSREIVSITLEEYNAGNTEIDPKKFYVINKSNDIPTSNSGVYFTGTNVQEVLNGAQIAWPDDSSHDVPLVSGLPINGYEGSSPELSHIELQNSLMSHQSYRNWCTFMEAEIALLQDLGYTIDRSKYFGKSIYNSGTAAQYFTYDNGQAFDSTTMHGIGLHVYGSYVDVTQNADINANGDYGIGIRVDGVGNKVTINSNVSANGEGGNGLLVAYGKKHNITLNAGKTIEATGTDGVAARFDFGSNELGDYIEYRGSYIQAENERAADGDVANGHWTISSYEKLPSALQGELVTNFNVSGTLKGQQAAIYISPNALVRNINITNGADIQGDIISEWNPNAIIYQNKDEDGDIIEDVLKPAVNRDEALTELRFGIKLKDDGTLDGGDSNYNMTYNGNIKGENSINMNIFGGNLEYNGTAEVQNIFIEGDSSLKTGGAILSGTGTYILTAKETGVRGSLHNDGTFDLGKGINKIYITGNYFQNGNAYLKVDFDTNGNSDKLVITEGNATLDGHLTLTPQVDYYYNGQKITIDVVDAKEINNNIIDNGDESKVIFNNISPVLNFSLNVDDTTPILQDGEYVINVVRVDQGYQSVATDDISSGIGSAIDIDSQKKKDDEQYVLTIDKEKLLTSLDYSLTITDSDAERKKVVSNNLKKLNPNVVGSQAQAVIETHTTLNNLVSTVSSLNVGSMSMNTPVSRRIGGLGPNRVEPPKYNSWRNIVIPFSSYTDQHNGSNGYTNHNSGVIGAMERTFANGLTHGYHAAINHQSTEDSGSTIKGEGIYLGTHASYAPADWNGWSVFGSARFGVEQMRSHRRVYISDSYAPYMGTADGDWTGYSGSFNIGAALTKEHGVVKSGPFAALDYSFAHRPSVHEDGGAVRTNLESATYDSLRTQLGYRLVTNPKPLDSYDSTQWQAHASVAWNHELLSDNGRTSYQLAEFPGTPIEDTIETYGRDSMSIAAGVIFKTPNRFDVGLTLGSDIYRKGGSSIYGKATFEWKF
ncbi:MAG: autotransporter domain-containing protein [Phascolarctobacterium sp.]|nr:autotransporter domain-containing protein [Phascolarctobacterium sp.]